LFELVAIGRASARSAGPMMLSQRRQHPIGSGMQPCCGGAFIGGDPGAGGGAAAWGGGAGGGGNVLTTGAGAATTVARGIASVSVCSPFCSVAALCSTDCKIQPL